MLGAIIGDIVGSRFEFNNHKSKNFELFTYDCEKTDDTVMTIAVAVAVAESKKSILVLPSLAVKYMRYYGRKYFDCGYGGRFRKWIISSNPKPYNSYGNGSAMRVSACGFFADSIEQAKELSYAVTSVTHNHPEGIKGAEATSVAIFLARQGKTKEEIKDYICNHYYDINFTLDEIRKIYSFDASCQGTVPQALECFFESTSFEDAIRNAISIGGDSDTIGAITGALAEAYYDIPEDVKKEALTFLEPELQRDILNIEEQIKK